MVGEFRIELWWHEPRNPQLCRFPNEGSSRPGRISHVGKEGLACQPHTHTQSVFPSTTCTFYTSLDNDGHSMVKSPRSCTKLRTWY
jgi:hypothetical protein